MRISAAFRALALAGPAMLLAMPAATPAFGRARAEVTPAASRLRVSSSFGERIDPFTGHPAMHRGVDLPGPLGTDVLAAAAGTVTFSGWSHGYGKLVELAHADGSRTRYGHLSAVLVREGDAVAQGQPIARMGSTGRSTGSHLHFEYWAQGRPVDPLRYLGGGVAFPASARPVPDDRPWLAAPGEGHRSAFALAREKAAADPAAGLPTGDRIAAEQGR